MTAHVEPAPSSPGSLIITFAGLHLRRVGGWVAVADLIQLLGRAGQSAPAVRQALARLKSRGFLLATTRDGRAGYELTALGGADLAAGDARIFRYGEAAPADGWVLAVFSVPEHAREKRHQLRNQLSWLGFGRVSAGVWIAPVALAQRTRDLLAEQDLDRFVTWFTGQTIDEARAADWWDLDSLQTQYEAFVGVWDRDRADRPDADEFSFVGYLQLVDQWRHFPRVDPGLPARLLPPDWQGRRAFEIFSRLRGRWEDGAGRFVDSALAARRPAEVVMRVGVV